jgi:hypothetical protein
MYVWCFVKYTSCDHTHMAYIQRSSCNKNASTKRQMHIIHTHTRIYIYIYIYIHIHTYIQLSNCNKNANKKRQMHIIHTYTHTYIYIHTYIITYSCQTATRTQTRSGRCIQSQDGGWGKTRARKISSWGSGGSSSSSSRREARWGLMMCACASPCMYVSYRGRLQQNLGRNDWQRRQQQPLQPQQKRSPQRDDDVCMYGYTLVCMWITVLGCSKT